MKTLIPLLLTFLLTAFAADNFAQENNSTKIHTLEVQSSDEMLPVVEAWVATYNGTENDVVLVQSEIERSELRFKTESELNAKDHSSWKMVVGRDVIIPVINAGHPCLNTICENGATQVQLKALLNSQSSSMAGEKANLYIMNDPVVMEALKNFAGIELNKPGVNIIQSKAEFNEVLAKDKLAIGFCRINTVADMPSNCLNADIAFLPIDVNENGRIDHVEKIYDSLNTFARGVWIGKYPKALVQNFYVLSPEAPTNPDQQKFIKWIVAAGNETLSMKQHLALVESEVPSKISVIDEIITAPRKVQESAAFPVWTYYAMATIFAVLILVTFVARRKKAQSLLAQSDAVAPDGPLALNLMEAPAGLYFDKTHTWTFMEKSGNVRVGLDDFMQHVAGPFSRIILKSEGEKVKKGDPLFIVIQDGKQLNIYSPLSGIIKAFNEDLIYDASKVNDTPYDEGWIYLIEPANWMREIEFLKNAENYTSWLKNEMSRLKDFVAGFLAKHHGIETLVLQDGGELSDHVLSHLGPEAWVDFQSDYLDQA